MTSNTLKMSGFRRWHSFRVRAFTKFLPDVPRESGVYVMRLAHSFGRLKGTSDILYIGSGVSKSGLRGRLRMYVKPNMTQGTAFRIHGKLCILSNVEISYAEFSKENAKKMEASLLKKYESHHAELPPWNRSLPRYKNSK